MKTGLERSGKHFRMVFSTLTMLSLVFLHAGSTVWAAKNDSAVQLVSGVVFHDITATGSYVAGTDMPLPGIAVSNGRDIVITDAQGRYSLEVGDHTLIFVIKPRNWMVPLDELQIPRFYYVHSPAGASGSRYAGLPPTPPLPESVDFPLYPAEEPDQFDVIVVADTQPRNEKELHYMMRDAIHELVGVDAAFGVTLGDLVFDDINLFDPLNEIIATIGIPWRHLIGNHDIDFSADDNTAARGAYYRTYGPPYYSFSYGPAHFLVLDNIRFIIDGDNRYYRPEVTQDHMTFIENELARIDKEQLLIVMMHIPWDDRGWNMQQRNRLMELLSDHPNALSLGAHWHRHYHRFLDEEYGFMGESPHHMISMGAICGAWWRGIPDEYMVPHAMMGDGTPAGYGVLSINQQEARLHWQSSRRPDSFQMYIDAPDKIKSQDTPGMVISANVFNAIPDARVTIQIGENNPTINMEYTIGQDPVKQENFTYERSLIDQLDEYPWLESRGASNSYKLWKTEITDPLKPGTYVITVRSEDRWWTHEGKKIIRVVY